MGHVFVNIMKGDTGSTFDANEYRETIQEMLRLAEKQNITDREKKHVTAVKLLADGERLKAMDVWEDILLDHPTDQFAIRNAVFTAGVALCNPERYRDMTTRALYAYKPSTPGYSNLLSMQAFGFEETKFYDKGEKIAKLSCEMLACHNHWHTALFKIDQGKFNEAMEIFDNEILPRAKASGTMFPLTDGASLLYRLEYEGMKTNDRWKELLELSHKHTGHYNWIFQDAHLMMIACRGGGPEMADKLLNGLKEFAENCTGDSAVVAKNVGVSLCEAIKAYQDGEYDKTTELLQSIRYDIYAIGGSDAQVCLYVVFREQNLIEIKFKIIMDSCEEYARRWAKKEDVQLDTLSEWIKSIRGLLLSRINRLKSTVNTRFKSISKDPDVITELTYLQEHYVITPADKASNNYTFTCKKYNFDSLVKELGLN
ncbi:hypothetical protein FSP39_023457 [Pinctada imbricata]|uniref:Tetratricopeptide repeat protein 38 n=1 Tax=Pinctada imbricata TaxID=66713 RepID=A0AA88YR75_PINIB|nr:hypothetical protein FSP39_023457 [Pinctada imbricata]